jgi:hypothetical protein
MKFLQNKKNQIKPYPFCCTCFRKLTIEDIPEENDRLLNICLICKNLLIED